ncbi:putative membrane protein [Aurantimicrobium minutum]|uniref:YhgE/Pip family protein n=1 Tax=Aurantimicrobium minutum TaxID=708131 RepID=UPI002474B4BB|nr:YhgE/Pip family protein [Aurantimicrobium minutum]MDH6532774.1 putative membrane protein [Aurantimicrobium minutum]
MNTLITRLSLNTAQTEGKPRALTLIGLLCVPLIVVGTLLWGLWNPTDRLDTVKAAIVNNDQPVTINGQMTPLGRILSAGLVDGVDGGSNYDWVITNTAGAKKGLSSGDYVAVVTIPKDFSQVATSSMTDASHPTQAVIDVTTSEKNRLVDDAITTAITSTAVNVLNQKLSANYIGNVLLGFSTLSEGLGTAAKGAHDLTTGMYSLADGAQKLSTGAQDFSAGMWALQSQSAALPGQTQQIADGLTSLSSSCSSVVPLAAQAQFCGSLSGLSAGTNAFAGGLTQLQGGISQLAAGSTDIATGVTGLATGSSALAEGSNSLANGLDTALTNIPVYTKEQTTALADVVTAPVTVSNAGTLSFGASSTPLYVVLALWIAAMASFIGLRALPVRLLESTRSSLSLATRSFVLPAIVGIVQGVAVATVIAIAQGFNVGEWLAVAGVSALISVAFTATNQALLAVLGGFGRLISLAVGILILVTGVISTVPEILDTVLGVTPANDAVTALQSVVNSAEVSGFAGALTSLILWTLGSIAVTGIAISRKRHVSITALSKETQPV